MKSADMLKCFITSGAFKNIPIYSQLSTNPYKYLYLREVCEILTLMTFWTPNNDIKNVLLNSFVLEQFVQLTKTTLTNKKLIKRKQTHRATTDRRQNKSEGDFVQWKPSLVTKKLQVRQWKNLELYNPVLQWVTVFLETKIPWTRNKKICKVNSIILTSMRSGAGQQTGSHLSIMNSPWILHYYIYMIAFVTSLCILILIRVVRMTVIRNVLKMYCMKQFVTFFILH